MAEEDFTPEEWNLRLRIADNSDTIDIWLASRLDEAAVWLEDRKIEYLQDGNCFQFLDPQAAMMFKLTFG